MFCRAPVHRVVSKSITESASMAAAEAVDLLLGQLSACLTLRQHSHTVATAFYCMYHITWRKFSSYVPGWTEEGSPAISSHPKIRLPGLAGFPASLWKVTGFSEDHPPHDNVDICF